jgi:hypothetical protein
MCGENQNMMSRLGAASRPAHRFAAGAVACLAALLLVTALPVVAQPKGMSAEEAARRDRDERIKRERAREDATNCYISERKRNSDQSIDCIYKCPSLGNRVESSSIGPGMSCPNVLNVLRR